MRISFNFRTKYLGGSIEEGFSIGTEKVHEFPLSRKRLRKQKRQYQRGIFNLKNAPKIVSLTREIDKDTLLPMLISKFEDGSSTVEICN